MEKFKTLLLKTTTHYSASLKHLPWSVTFTKLEYIIPFSLLARHLFLSYNR